MFKSKKKKEELDRLNELKGFRFQSLLSALLFIMIGAVITINPVKTTKTICLAIGYIILAVAAVYIIGYFISDFKNNLNRNKLVIGIILFLIGLFFIIGYRVIMSIIPLILGVMIFLSGLTKLQTALDARKISKGKNEWMLIIAVVNILLGLFVCFNPFVTGRILLKIIGICIVFSGVTDLINLIYVSKKVRDYIKDMKALEQ